MVLDRMMHNEPMRWQGLLMDMETNVLSLVAFRTWLAAEWYEKELLKEDFPEFHFLDDDMLGNKTVGKFRYKDIEFENKEE